MNTRLLATISLVFLLTACGAPDPGEVVYNGRCATCHNSVESRAPMMGALKQMSAARILRALDFGVMMSVAQPLDRTERDAVAKWLGTAEDARKLPTSAYCADRKVTVGSASWNGWSRTPDNARFSPELSAANLGKLKLKWTFGFDGDTNSFGAASVLGDALFVGSAGGGVYALDRNSGCIKWMFQADGPVRMAPTVAGPAVLFGDQIGWFYSVDATTGKQLWKNKPEAHESTKLTGSPTVANGIVYVPTASWEEMRALNTGYRCCTFRSSVTAYKVDDGTQLWQTYMIAETPQADGKTLKDGRPEWGPSGAGIWSAPTVDTKLGRIYVTTGNNYTGASANSDAVVALDLSTGKILWSRQFTSNDAFSGLCAGTPECGPDFDFGSSVITRGDMVIAGQKSGMVYALAAKDGKTIWQARVGRGGTNGGVQWGMAADADNLYAAVSDVSRIRTQKNPLDPSPNGMDANIGGGITALRIRDGKQVWFTPPVPCDAARVGCAPGQPAAVTAINGAVLSGSIDGHLRAFSTKDGTVLWDFDTIRNWDTVNGVKAKGGAIDGAGPVVANGMVFQQSGYSRNGGAPGNVLLAWGIE